MAKKRVLFPCHRLRRRGLGLGTGLLLAVAWPLLETALSPQLVHAYVALMSGQSARPLNGQFNRVPVLHSNQPEEVEGPGILINTAPGSAYSPENGQVLNNSEFTFNGDFGVHLHHKYFPPYRAQITRGSRRTELTIGLVLINPGSRPVHIRFSSGAVRNSFEAPYLAESLTGVRPLGPRPWNTGPGDATAIQLLRGRLDSRLSDEVTIPARSRVVLFSKDVPALGIANALLRGRSDGPFQMAVVAARRPQSDWDLLAVLDRGQLAPGRVYLSRVAEIENRQIFSRVGGVALGDTYSAHLSHNLELDGPLHVPLTSTFRHHFGTRDIQVNPLASRMLDSALDNVGTYGVRFDIDLNLRGEGPYDLVLSHPVALGGRPFTAFRGSLQIRTPDGLREVHVVLRSGQSLSLASLNLTPGKDNPVTVSLVYPADATPGHLLSVVPATQLSQTRKQERQIELAKARAEEAARLRQKSPRSGSKPDNNGMAEPAAPPPPPSTSTPALANEEPMEQQAPFEPLPPMPPITMPPSVFPPSIGPVLTPAVPSTQTLIDRYQQALEAQQTIMRGLINR
jgi:hypothetical protein